MKKLLITSWLIILCYSYGNCQLIGKTRDQILKNNYAKNRELASMGENLIMFKEARTSYLYYFDEGDTCYQQILHVPMEKLNETVKEYTSKYKLIGPMSWVDKNNEYMYTLYTDLSYAGPSPDGKEYFAIKIQDYGSVVMQRIFEFYNQQSTE